MQNVVVAVYNEESVGYQAFTTLKQAYKADKYSIYQMALVQKTAEGLKVCDNYTPQQHAMDDTLAGGLIGGFIGILGGPVGVLLMGSYGMLAGSMVDMENAVDEASILEMTAEKLNEGIMAIIILAKEDEEAELDAKLAEFDPQILRYDAADIAEQVEEANEVQAELQRQAKEKLHAERKADRKERREQFREKIQSAFDDTVHGTK